MLLLDLPEDIFNHILGYLQTTPRCLCALARTCTALQVAAERALYRSVTLQKPRHFILGARSIAVYNKGQYVKRLAIRLWLSSMVLFARHHVQTLRVLLDSVPNLRTLDLTGPTPGPPQISFLHPGLPFRLQSLSTTAPFDSNLTAFLEQQHSLHELHLTPSRSSSAPRLPIPALRELRTLSVPDFLVALLCCARPVRSLHVIGRVYDGLLRSLALGASLTRDGKLQTLSIEVVPSARNLAILSATLPSVQQLTVRIPRFETLAPLLDTAVGPALAAFARLEDFEVHPPPLTRVDAHGEDWDTTVAKWMTACPSLRRVSLPGRSWGYAAPRRTVSPATGTNTGDMPFSAASVSHHDVEPQCTISK